MQSWEVSPLTAQPVSPKIAILSKVFGRPAGTFTPAIDADLRPEGRLAWQARTAEKAEPVLAPGTRLVILRSSFFLPLVAWTRGQGMPLGMTARDWRRDFESEVGVTSV